MGIFSKISEAIFGKPAQARGIGQANAETAGAEASTANNWWMNASAQGGGAMSETDVEAQLETRAQSHGERLNWRTSIVDLMKLVGIDPSLENRKELARELGYTGDTGDSASMNIWLHRQVMRELAANGGRVPATLTD